MKIILIVNLFSGKGKAKEYSEKASEILSSGNDLQIYETIDKESTIAFVRENCNNCDMLAVIGGDGTLNEVINGYMEAGSKTPIGYIPSGSTNDFASTLKLKSDPVEACKSFLQLKTRRLDIGSFNGRYFNYVAAAGAFSKTSYATPTALKNKIGHLAYILGGIVSVPTIKPIHMKIVSDGEVFEDDYFISMISNSTRVGGVFSYEESLVSLDDGKFEVIMLKEPDRINEIGSLLKDVFCHKYNGDYITLTSGSDICITSPQPIAWSLDGEYGGEYTEMHIKNHKEAIALLI